MSSRWAHVTEAAPDPILGVSVAFNADTNDKKVNLGIGAYRDENGKPWVLGCVKEAEKKIAADLDANKINEEYLPVQGLQQFLDLTSKVILGDDSKALAEKRVAVCQSLSGTGALRIAAEFLAIYNPGTTVYLSDPTWSNHHNIFGKAGLTVKTYRYLTKTMTLDLDGMLEDLKGAVDNCTFVFHTVAHNPSGVDPTPDQWKQVLEVTKNKNAVPIFDTAYQGYATGDLNKDAWSVRFATDELGMELMVTQSYSKNFGLYGERIGALNIVTKDADSAKKVRSQLLTIVRPMYSNPQLHGARLVAGVLSDEALYKQWDAELKMMSNRIVAMRTSLLDALKANGCPTPSSLFPSWGHIGDQIGMFAYTGLQAKHVEVLTSKWHIYCTKNGRFSMAGINPGNVAYIADAMKDAIETQGPSDQ
jgi:aspartate/tyrosine/aromatic aminotransferase